ncbi:MAG: hypothetical protein K0S60_11 [Evtepia sp.]|nr:hypothetical protein [Evtepia sp.]
MDKILVGGVIYTMAGKLASALAVHKGRIVLVGTNEEVLALQTEDTDVIDLKGRCALPGFTDSHMHMLLSGVGFDRLDLRGVRSPEEIIERGREYIRKHKISPGEWVVGYGFDHNLFASPVLPGREVAGAISEEHPVLLDRVCGHVGAVNALALELAGFGSETVIPGGELDKQANGMLSGVIRETALDQMKTHIPKLSQKQVEQILKETGHRFAKVGLTAVHSDDLGPEGTDLGTLSKAIHALKEKKELSIRIYEEWEAPRPKLLRDIISKGYYSGWGDDFLRVCNIKLITDGSLGARTAYLREEYSDDSGNRGIPVYTQAELDEMVGLCHEAGLQVAFHAIGDAALEQCICAVEKAMRSDPKPLRHRIVHCQIGAKSLYERMASLGMGADIQPPFTISDAPLVAPRLGKIRQQESYAWKMLLDCGVPLGGGSDSPVEAYDPLWGIYCAVTREDGSGGAPWMPEQRLTVEEAVALYTKGPAYLASQEAHAGTLEAGKLADLIVLDRDIFQIPSEEIKDLKVELTMMGGQITYCKE